MRWPTTTAWLATGRFVLCVVTNRLSSLSTTGTRRYSMPSLCCILDRRLRSPVYRSTTVNSSALHSHSTPIRSSPTPKLRSSGPTRLPPHCAVALAHRKRWEPGPIRSVPRPFQGQRSPSSPHLVMRRATTSFRELRAMRSVYCVFQAISCVYPRHSAML